MPTMHISYEYHKKMKFDGRNGWGLYRKGVMLAWVSDDNFIIPCEKCEKEATEIVGINKNGITTTHHFCKFHYKNREVSKEE